MANVKKVNEQRQAMEYPEDVQLPHGTQLAGHVWLHSRWWSAWNAGRKAQARAALGAMGLSAPTKGNA